MPKSGSIDAWVRGWVGGWVGGGGWRGGVGGVLEVLGPSEKSLGLSCHRCEILVCVRKGGNCNPFSVMGKDAFHMLQLDAL